jgi:hypothetical protein
LNAAECDRAMRDISSTNAARRLAIIGLVAAATIWGGCTESQSGRARAPSGPPPNSPALFAPAPSWLSVPYLGAPLDARFQPIQGGGTTVFPRAPVLSMPHRHFRHEKVTIEDSTSFAANISGWGAVIGAEAEMSSGIDQRFASYRAYDITSISALDDRYPASTPPPGAVWYPARIYWGHSYEVVVFGHKRSFTTKVAAQFRVLEASVETFANTNNLQVRMTGRGLSPSQPGAIYAGTPEDVRSKYTDAGPPAPIFVEYRLIPGAVAPSGAAVEWLVPRDVEIRFDTIDMQYQINWFAAHWYAEGFCVVNGGEKMIDAGPVTTGQLVNNGTRLTLGWIATLNAFPGDVVQCGLKGRYDGIARGGAIATSVMPPVTIADGGSWAGAFYGSSEDTKYTVNYQITVREPTR